MRIKVLKLGEAAKEVEVTDGSTVNDVIQQSNFRREHQTIMLNGQPAFETGHVHEGNVSIMNSKFTDILFTYFTVLIPLRMRIENNQYY